MFSTAVHPGGELAAPADTMATGRPSSSWPSRTASRCAAVARPSERAPPRPGVRSPRNELVRASERAPVATRGEVARGKPRPAGRLASAALDQLDPVAVWVPDEADPGAAGAHLIRRPLRLDALLRQRRERRVEVLDAEGDMAVAGAEVVRPTVMVERQLELGVVAGRREEVVRSLQLAVPDDRRLAPELEAERLVEGAAAVEVGDPHHRVQVAGHAGSVRERARQRQRSAILEILGHEPVEDAVDPTAVASVRLPAHPFPDEADALGEALRALVEAVDLELEPVVAEHAEQLVAQEPRRLGGDASAAVTRVDGEAGELRDPAASVHGRELDNADALTGALDDEEAELSRLAQRAQPAGVLAHVVGAAAPRRTAPSAPDPSATPPRISTSPPSAPSVTRSCRIRAP